MEVARAPGNPAVGGPPGRGSRAGRRCRLRRAAILAATALAAGCGSDRTADGGPITVQVFGDAIELDGYRRVAAAYERATGKSVRLVGLADRDSHLAKLTTSFSAGRPPDAFVLSYRNFGPFVGRGVIAPVAQGAPAEGLFPVVERAFTIGGRLQCRPVSASPLVVYVNRAVFDAAGVALPRADWDFDEFFRAALELRARTRARGAREHPLGIDPVISRLAMFIWTAGGALVEPEAQPRRFAFESAAARQGIGRFLSLYREALVPTENATEAEALDVQFASGRLAMFVSSQRDVATFRRSGGLSWDVVAFPRGQERATALEAEAICAARARHSSAAADFAAFAGGPEGQRILARTGRFMPVLTSIAESADFLQPGRPPESARVFADAMSTARALPSTENWPRIEDSAALAFKRAFYAELSVQAAIDRVEAETEALF